MKTLESIVKIIVLFSLFTTTFVIGWLEGQENYECDHDKVEIPKCTGTIKEGCIDCPDE